MTRDKEKEIEFAVQLPNSGNSWSWPMNSIRVFPFGCQEPTQAGPHLLPCRYIHKKLHRKYRVAKPQIRHPNDGLRIVAEGVYYCNNVVKTVQENEGLGTGSLSIYGTVS